jgi:hypothetical protein
LNPEAPVSPIPIHNLSLLVLNKDNLISVRTLSVATCGEYAEIGGKVNWLQVDTVDRVAEKCDIYVLP